MASIYAPMPKSIPLAPIHLFTKQIVTSLYQHSSLQSIKLDFSTRAL